MLTGVIKGSLLCCEIDNFTWNSATDIDEDLVDGKESLLRSVYKTIIPIILSLGIFGNILILAILSTPLFHGIAYLYFRGLALAHLGVLLSWIPISIRLARGIKNNYPSVFYYAHLELVATNTFATASTLIMTCLIVDRYIFVFFPARIRSGNARKNVRTLILYSFILGFSANAPLAVMRLVNEQQTSAGIIFTLGENVSITRSVLWTGYIWIMEITLRVCPAILFIVLNSMVIKRFLQFNAKKKQFQSVSEKFRTAITANSSSSLIRNRGYKEEQRIATLSTAMALCFIVTMIPSILIPIQFKNYEKSNIGYQLFRAFAALVELSNFGIHAITYLTCSKEFRAELFKILQGRCSEGVDEDFTQPVGEIEDFSRHGTTVRLTPENTRLNSPGSPGKLNTMDEDKESEVLSATDAV